MFISGPEILCGEALISRKEEKARVSRTDGVCLSSYTWSDLLLRCPL